MTIATAQATARDIWASSVQRKVERIRAEAKAADLAVLRLAETSVQDRFIGQFFEAAYADIHGAAAIAERAFVNIGPGSFNHPFWTNVDKHYHDNALWSQMRRGVPQVVPDVAWDILDHVPLPLPDGSMHLAYCSHVVEHVWDEDILHLFREVRRVLRPGGVFRVVCPDADLLARAYQEGDWWFFLDYAALRARRMKLGQMDVARLRDSGYFARFVLDQVSLVTNRRNSFFVDAREAPDFLARFPTLTDAFDRASKLSDRALNLELGAHVNWLSFAKLRALLTEAGFTRVERSGHRQSRAAVLRDERFFDRTDPQMSVFVDAVT